MPFFLQNLKEDATFPTGDQARQKFEKNKKINGRHHKENHATKVTKKGSYQKWNGQDTSLLNSYLLDESGQFSVD